MRVIESVNTEDKDVHKQLVNKGSSLILDLQLQLLKDLKEEKPEWPGVPWDVIFYLIAELKKKEPDFVFATSMEDAKKQLDG